MIDIHGYSRRLESARLRLASLDNGELLPAFIDHLEALGLSKGRLAKYANHICAIMKKHPFNPSDAASAAMPKRGIAIKNGGERTPKEKRLSSRGLNGLLRLC